MPKVKDKSLPASWVKDYPDLILEGSRIFCRCCMKTISIEKKYNVIQHINTNSHQNNSKKGKGTAKQQSLTESLGTSNLHYNTQNKFSYDLCNAMVSANIPFKKLENKPFRQFLETYCGRAIPSESILRKKYLDEVYINVFTEIKSAIGNNYVWFTVDETTDSCGRYIANLIVGTLSGDDERKKSYLVFCKELQKTNHTTIARFVQEGFVNLFLPNRVPSEKIILMLSDAAPYMVKAGNSLKIFYENLIHCTCLAHGLSRVAETIRLQFPLVNELITNGKRIFVKAPLRVQAFKEHHQNISLPPEPVLTRWGTWLEAAMYYAKYLKVFHEFVTELPETAAISIRECHRILKANTLDQDLAYLQSNYTFVSHYIEKLEKQNTTLIDSVEIILDFQKKLKDIRGQIGDIINKKFDEVLGKNEGFDTLYKISMALQGNQIDDFKINVPLNIFKYAPITSVDVERSFSIYKTILTDRRQSFTMENIEKYVIINCYKPND